MPSKSRPSCRSATKRSTSSTRSARSWATPFGSTRRPTGFCARCRRWGAPDKPIGVINLADRVGGDAFTAGDRKLVAAIANQIGAAIENARLVARDLGQQRVLRELELARDLQLKLLPSPLVVASRVDVA